MIICRNGIILPSHRRHNSGSYLIHIPKQIVAGTAQVVSKTVQGTADVVQDTAQSISQTAQGTADEIKNTVEDLQPTLTQDEQITPVTFERSVSPDQDNLVDGDNYPNNFR